MKKHIILIACGLSLLGWLSAPAQSAPEGRPEAGGQNVLDQLESGEVRDGSTANLPEPGELLVLERFLDMPPERLAQIRATLERIEKMSPEEKEALRSKICEYRKLHADKRQQLQRRFEQIPPEDRGLMRAYLASLPRREALQTVRRIRNAAPEEREAMIRELVGKARAQGLEPRFGPPPGEGPPPGRGEGSRRGPPQERERQ